MPGDGEATASPSASARFRTARTAPDDLPIAERRRRAFDVALRSLERRERSTLEVRLLLRRKGYDGDTIAVTVARLQEAGYLSDARYAEGFAEEAALRRGYAPAEIRRRLRAKGVDSETAAAAAAVGEDEEALRARDAAAKRARSLASYPEEVRIRRIEGFLARRGYRGELARRLAAELGRAAGSDSDIGPSRAR